ncbi:hypothetical protein QBC35DRAFT_10087 [Podospora australis]|uniref:Uncharacterized protein n=1 Tax=Podospora australis TaxID=1536484 RepID=A0AAN6X5C4_9PEZI|nr:hypothetical protein QBC35DRAFT_10087 [Podospora australis]
MVVSGEKWRGLSGKYRWRPSLFVLRVLLMFLEGELSGTWLMGSRRAKGGLYSSCPGCARAAVGYLGQPFRWGPNWDANVGNFEDPQVKWRIACAGLVDRKSSLFLVGERNFD